jgi:hypothetical protein
MSKILTVVDVDVDGDYVVLTVSEDGCTTHARLNVEAAVVGVMQKVCRYIKEHSELEGSGGI